MGLPHTRGTELPLTDTPACPSRRVDGATVQGLVTAPLRCRTAAVHRGLERVLQTARSRSGKRRFGALGPAATREAGSCQVRSITLATEVHMRWRCLDKVRVCL